MGSGLDRAKLDQMKRLCRRLRAETCKAVDAHTTHLVVQVRLALSCTLQAHPAMHIYAHPGSMRPYAHTQKIHLVLFHLPVLSCIAVMLARAVAERAASM